MKWHELALPPINLLNVPKICGGNMENYSMWDYWKEKRGSVYDALVYDYQETLKEDKDLQMLIAQIRCAELAINAIMVSKEEENT